MLKVSSSHQFTNLLIFLNILYKFKWFVNQYVTTSEFIFYLGTDDFAIGFKHIPQCFIIDFFTEVFHIYIVELPHFVTKNFQSFPPAHETPDKPAIHRQCS